MSRSARCVYWSDLLAEQKLSGESIAAFCRRRDISAPSFYAWRKRLLDKERPVTDSPFVPVSVVDGDKRIEVQFPGDVIIRLPRDRELVSEFLGILLERGRAS